MNSLPQNPFTRPPFWGRQNELKAIYRYLLSTPSQSCAIIGETSFGKTTLLRYLADPRSASVIDDLVINDKFTFMYLDCISYIGSAQLGDFASARFWWDLYSALWTKLRGDLQIPLSETKASTDQPPLDRAFEFKSALEDLIRQQSRPVIFVLDNFEGIACLPRRDSEWLRSLVQYPCAYVVASRHLLYLLYQYHSESWASPSPLWNLFSDPIYLGLLAEHEVQDFLLQANLQARQLESFWESRDIDFIRKIAGRHPEIIRIACARLFEQRLLSSQSLKIDEKELLEFSIYKDTSPLCRLLWRGLADPELWNIPGVTAYRDKEAMPPSPYQKALIDLAHEREITDKKILFVLEQRGLIERTGGKWHIFAEVMRQFVLEQEVDEPTRESQRLSHISPTHVATQISTTSEQWEPLSLTYLEDKVYTYLKLHTGEVCDREEIKQVVWEREYDLPGNSALQKIIERIREKIEPDPNNPRYLIAVRGQGYMLREDPLNSSIV